MTYKNSSVFRDWMLEETPNKIGEILKINPATVRHWVAGRGWPKIRQMKEIKKLTNGRVDYVDMIEGCQFGKVFGTRTKPQRSRGPRTIYTVNENENGELS